jgi:hypothetical protein
MTRVIMLCVIMLSVIMMVVNILSIIVLNFANKTIILSVFVLIVGMLSVIMLRATNNTIILCQIAKCWVTLRSVIMLSVIMLIIMAPFKKLKYIVIICEGTITLAYLAEKINWVIVSAQW